jgi:hypothetical protein
VPQKKSGNTPRHNPSNPSKRTFLRVLGRTRARTVCEINTVTVTHAVDLDRTDVHVRAHDTIVARVVVDWIRSGAKGWAHSGALAEVGLTRTRLQR